ncbi:NAD(P)-dependent dehydrogenase (short-subunit alcohol dehydrogenase family) [Palleronia aestuarii]|uniref:NAD(P)-dependent dehydrogenase (Short-subunit alcohol dehydrogenase family) n=1 Tax=Palleronia aestuarii TaxID=568105 RepID=A0A2W7MWL6_9RHOB|nr:SDR family oxidoreductase [Palleronia aestuarii]PZX10537.1 NAD(P)-dependent dehydrogenase (short-subunit alcohol dehydrogenase family) [Palleronia aestuarii]
MDYAAKLSLSGKRALVTGAGQGIGAACAEALAATGAHVICTDLDPARAEAHAKSLSDKGLSAVAHTLDVTDSDAIRVLSDRLGAVDILVCNAGVVTSAAAEEMTDEAWEHVTRVNLTGVFRCCRTFGAAMLEAGGGAIVNIGSMSGQIVNTPQPQCHYNASKAAVHQLTRSLAVEWARRGVRVNAVAPTYIATPLLDNVEDGAALMARWKDLTPMGRLGEPHEVASAVQFLASDAASLMTGVILNVDAGYTCL